MRRVGWVIAAVLLATVVIGGGVVTAVRVNAAPPPPVLHLDVPATYVPVPGPPVPVHQPPQGSLALQGLGHDIALLDADTPHPIASVAKVMTAYRVLQVDPLADQFDEGPVLTMTDVDVQDWHDTVRKDGSSLPVAVGERLTEKQLLLGLLLPSANNFADTLGRWVSGSVDGFVSDLNAAASQLGMTHTHFADPSGFSPQTVASASDLVILGKKVLEVPALAAIVATQHAKLPDGTALDNLDTLLGSEPGWLGIKTGSTPEAGGCLLFAARQQVGTGDLTLVGAVLGQTDLAAALDAAKTAVETGFQGYGVVHMGDVPTISGTVTTRWGDTSAVHISTAGDATGGVAVRMGTVLRLTVRTTPLAARESANYTLAVIAGYDGDTRRFDWAVILDRSIELPSAMWMLFKN
jgi:serine-type D-Ala-D-Ala carboxypeptidase (penicillin-binding protein 5/6)